MNSKKTASVIVPSLLVVALWIAMAGIPSMRASNAADERLASAESDRSALARSLVEVQGLSAMQGETERSAHQIEAAIPSQLELGSLLQAIDGAGYANGVAVGNFSPIQITDNASSTQATRMPDGISSVSFGLSAEGSYDSILDFFEAVESLDRLVIFDSVDVFTGTEDSAVLIVEGRLRIFTSGAITEFEATNRSQGGALALSEGSNDQSDPDREAEGGDAFSEHMPPGLTEVELSEFVESIGSANE